MLSRFHLIPERVGQTDKQTDRIAISISRVSMLTRDKLENDEVMCCGRLFHTNGRDQKSKKTMCI